MSKVLTTEQREQAGADSYNRFEYQVFWIVYHIINKLQDNSECIIFCEFHDDMAEFSLDDKQYRFFQIKTKEDSSDWTIAEISKREKNNSGGYKKSFLGFIFYNFLMFGDECKCCYFISNNDFDADIRLWQSYVEDEKILRAEDNKLYEKIKGRIKDEYLDNLPSNFDLVYDNFIQNTFVRKSDLQLTTYADQTMGKFFNHLADIEISTNTANLIFQQLLGDVRKKSKEKIKTPISFKSLTEKKGVVVSQVNKKINENIKNQGNYNAFHEFLISLSLPKDQIQQIEKAKKYHDARWLDVNDMKYQETVLFIRRFILSFCKDIDSTINIDDLNSSCVRELEKENLLSESLDDGLVEVLYYEQRFNSIDK